MAGYFHRLRFPNGTLITMSPRAAQLITPVQQERIAYQLAPKGSTVELSHGHGWTCRLFVDGKLVAEEHDHVTPTAAVRVAALGAVIGEQADPITEAKAYRDWTETDDWAPGELVEAWGR